VKSQEVSVQHGDGRCFDAWVLDGVLYVQGVVGAEKKLPLPIGSWVEKMVDLRLSEPYTDEVIRQAAVTAVEFMTNLLDR